MEGITRMGEANRIRYKTRGGGNLNGVYNRIWPSGPPYNVDHPIPISHWSSIKTPYTVWRYMVDTHGFLQDDFNPCYHERYVGVYNFPSSVSWTATDGVHQISTSYRRQLDDPVAGCRSIELPLGTWLPDFSARAENHFVTLVSSDGSLINFIIEMIQIMEGNVSLLDRLKKGIEDAIAAFRRKFAETGSYWLSWNFAIKPTIGDIKNMLNVYKRAIKRLKWLRERNHKNTKVKYREGPRYFHDIWDFPMAEDIVEQPYFSPTPVNIQPKPWLPPIYEEWPDWLVLHEKCEVEYDAKVTLSAWAWIRFDIPDAYLEGVPALGIVMSAMQGLYNPLEIAWEAVPFSWLIDWFRTESHRLREALKSDLNPLGHAEILAVGWTADITILGQFFHRCGMSTNGGVDPTPNPDQWSRTEAGAFRYKLYNRQPGLPDVGDSPFRVPWEWYNASILTALIQSKRRR